MHAQTLERAEWWAKPRTHDRTWIATYQNSLQSRQRPALVEIVQGIGAETLLEIGAHCGPNLVCLAEAIPGLRMIGIDANADAVHAGRAWMHQKGIQDRVQLNVARFPAGTEQLPSKAFDVVLSCYAAGAYTAPDDVPAMLYELGRLAIKAVVLAEPMVFDAPTREHWHGDYQEWQHDYRSALRWVTSLRGWTSRVVPLEPPVDRLNAILVLESGEGSISNSPS